MAAKSKRKKAGQAPISSHPAFPAIVALWFAALFGFGSLVLPVMLVEKLVTVTGIASLVPAAAPPLGITARMLIALVAAGIGVALGIVLARRVAAAQGYSTPAHKGPKLRAADSHPDAPVKRPISATEELGSERLDEPVHEEKDPPRGEPIPGRRRPLSVTDERGRSEFLDAAPLPGGAYAFAEPAQEVEDESDDEDDALELDTFETSDASEDIVAAGNDIPDVTMPLTNQQLREMAEADTVDAAPRAFDHPATGVGTTAPHAHESASAAPFAQPQEGPTMADDTPFGQPAQFDSAEDDFRPLAPPATQAQPEPAPQPAPFAAPMPLAATPPAQEAAPVAAPEPAFEPAPAPAVAAPVEAATATGALSDLTVAQLVERFAQALGKQRDAAAAPISFVKQQSAETPAASVTAPEPTPVQEQQFVAPAAPVEFAPPAPETVAAQSAAPAPFAAPAAHAPAAQALEEHPLPFARPPEPIEHVEVEHNLQMPRALQPPDLESEVDGEDDDLGPLSLELGEAARPFAAPAASADPYASQPDYGDEDESEDGTESEDGYSSLLAMKRPLSGNQEFVRIDDKDPQADGTTEAEPVVVFPHQQDRRAAPAQDGPSRAPASGGSQDPARPFDAPQGSESVLRNGGLGPAAPTNPPASKSDPSETEKALREALEKLQRMSGAA